MKTKDEIVESIWKQAKKSFLFHVASGFILPLALLFFPTKVHVIFYGEGMLAWYFLVSVMFIVYGALELYAYRKKNIRKIYDSMMDKKNNTKFMYKSVFGKTTEGESILVGVMTKSYSEFYKAMDEIFICIIFGPIVFACLGLVLFSMEDNTLWLHANPYIAIILLVAYIYLAIRIMIGYYKIWNEEFTFDSCQVKLAYHAEMPLEYVLPNNENKEEFIKQLTKDCIDDFVKKEKERDSQ